MMNNGDLSKKNKKKRIKLKHPVPDLQYNLQQEHEDRRMASVRVGGLLQIQMGYFLKFLRMHNNCSVPISCSAQLFDYTSCQVGFKLV